MGTFIRFPVASKHSYRLHTTRYLVQEFPSDCDSFDVAGSILLPDTLALPEAGQIVRLLTFWLHNLRTRARILRPPEMAKELRNYGEVFMKLSTTDEQK